jgi:hypothetical protein
VGVRLEEIFAGEGQLWGLPDSGRNLLFIKTSTGEARAHGVRRACGELAYPSGVVRLGELWLSCSRTIAVYKSAGGAGRVLGSPRSYHLLASTVGVWAVVPRGLVGIAGGASGRTIALRDAADLQAQGHEAWALDRSSLNRRLIQIDLVTGVVRRVALALQGQAIDHFAVGPNDIWVTLTDKPLILRFDRSAPKRPTAQIDLATAATSREFQIFLSAGPSYAWAEVFSNQHSKLFRVTAPN